MLAKHIHVDNVYRSRGGEYRRVVAICQPHDGHAPDVEFNVAGESPAWKLIVPLEQFAHEAVCDLTTPPEDEPLLTVDEAAQRIGTTANTLKKWRRLGTPKRYLAAGTALPYVRLPEGLRYRHRDVEAFRETMAAQVQV